MESIVEWLGVYGLAFAFANVFAEQLGLPVPAYPVLVITGAHSVDGRYSALALLAVAVAGCLIADLVWYFAGRRSGHKILGVICRISFTPDKCVRQTESLFERWGVWSLLVVKFVPGLATLATALAGSTRLPLLPFLIVDALGAALYAGVGIALGIVFHEAIDELVGVLAELGRLGSLLVASALLLFAATRWLQRRKLLKGLQGARITVQELRSMLAGAVHPIVLDARATHGRTHQASIPGSLPWPESSDEVLRTQPSDSLVVVYCACPNEVSAAKVVLELRNAGFTNVRALLGGIEAWADADRCVDQPGTA